MGDHSIQARTCRKGNVFTKRYTSYAIKGDVTFYPTGKQLESFCDRFAGAILIPKEVFTSDWGGFRRRISLEELIDLRRRYGMSIARHHVPRPCLKLIDDATHRQFSIIRRKSQWHCNEPGEYKGTEESSRFEQLILRATAEEEISFDKGAALLNVPLVAFQQTLCEFL